MVPFPFPIRPEAADTYLLLKDRPASIGFALTFPQPSSGTVLKTIPQLFIREVWELFFFYPVNL